MNTVAFLIITVLTLTGALAAATLRNLMHAALCLVVAFVGIAAFYFLLGAEFVGLVQVFVYVGAVAVLIVFTILLTRREGTSERFRWIGAAVGLAVFSVLLWAILKTGLLSVTAPPMPALTVKQIGEVLMSDYVWPLLCVGVVLTVALLGALILAMEDKQ